MRASRGQPRRCTRFWLAAFSLAIREPSPRGAPVAPDSLGVGLRCFLPGASTAPPLRPCAGALRGCRRRWSMSALTFDATLPLGRDSWASQRALPSAPLFVPGAPLCPGRASGRAGARCGRLPSGRGAAELVQQFRCAVAELWKSAHSARRGPATLPPSPARCRRSARAVRQRPASCCSIDSVAVRKPRPSRRALIVCPLRHAVSNRKVTGARELKSNARAAVFVPTTADQIPELA